MIDSSAVVLDCVVEGGINIGQDSVVTHCHLNVSILCRQDHLEQLRLIDFFNKMVVILN